jgi:hypothetical protein
MRSRGAILSVVTSSAGLELTISCPVCGKRGVVTLTNAEAFFRCPDCRQAFQMSRGCELRWADDIPSPKPRRRRRVTVARRHGDPPQWVGPLLLVSGALVLPLLAVFWWLSWRGSPVAGVDEAALASRAFTEAWLAGDRQTAGKWIDEVDQPYFHTWWRSTRAVLVAGAGRDFRWGNVHVEPVDSADDPPADAGENRVARLRVRFVAGRSEQQRIQSWKRTAGGWRFDVRRESSPPDGDGD